MPGVWGATGGGDVRRACVQRVRAASEVARRRNNLLVEALNNDVALSGVPNEGIVDTLSN